MGGRGGRRPEEYLPLTAVAFEVLLALADGERHGYAIMRAVEEQTGGDLRLHPGTLYRALSRLAAEGLLEELAERAEAGGSEEARRRYFRLTQLGRWVAEAEARRLEARVRAARSKRLLPRTRRA